MNPKKLPSRAVWIENTHDLAAWLVALPEVTEDTVTVGAVVDALLAREPEDWKKCTKCLHIYNASFFDTNRQSRDGYRYICKACRRKVHRDGARRRRANKKAMQNPEDLKEIQRHRQDAELKPLPFGKDAPKPGRPAVGSILYETETVDG